VQPEKIEYFFYQGGIPRQRAEDLSGESNIVASAEVRKERGVLRRVG
jgi:hypothetical protein